MPSETNASSSNTTKMIVLLAASILFSTAFAYILVKQPVVLVQNDFFSRWYATRMLLTGGRRLYDPQNGREDVAFYKIPMDPNKGNFHYPSYLIIFILPLIGLPYNQALFVWLVLIQPFFIFSIWLIFRQGQSRSTNFQYSLFLRGSRF